MVCDGGRITAAVTAESPTRIIKCFVSVHCYACERFGRKCLRRECLSHYTQNISIHPNRMAGSLLDVRLKIEIAAALNDGRFVCYPYIGRCKSDCTPRHRSELQYVSFI